MKSPIDDTLRQMLQAKLEALEQYLNADVFVYYGSLAPVSANMFAKLVEDLKADVVKRDKLYVILTTLGGSAEIVERYVNILRYHYSEINFIVPDYAYSAGTIFCMSGDRILMDYISVLGPIDPQVPNKDNKYVAALGYLDKINEFIDKASKGTLTKALENLLSKYAVDIEVENTDDVNGLIEAIIKANKNLNESSNNKDWEMMGKDIKKLQDLIASLENVKEDEEKKKRGMGKYFIYLIMLSK